MAGLGDYTLSPQLDGSIFAYHSHRIIRGSYANEIDFFYSLQKYDWQLFYAAMSAAIDTANKLFTSNYYTRNAAGAHLALTNFMRNFSTIHRDRPDVQGRSAKYMIDMLPLFAATRNKAANQELLEAHQVIREYFDRYLAKYANHDNSFLTA